MSFTCPGFGPAPDARTQSCGIGELEGGPDAEMVDAVLEGAAALAEGEFAPLDRDRRHASARAGTMAW